MKITKENIVEIATREQIEVAIEIFGEEIKGKVSTPESKHLLWVDDTKPLLDQELKDTLHSVNDKFLYITKRGSPDIKPPWCSCVKYCQIAIKITVRN